MTEQIVCPAIIKTGDRKGKGCGNPSKHGVYCGIHKRLAEVRDVPLDDTTDAVVQNEGAQGRLCTRVQKSLLCGGLKPLFKWSGGKGDEIKTFLSYIPEDFRNPISRNDGKRRLYLEPFVGGGALFFSLMPAFVHKGRDVRTPTEGDAEDDDGRERHPEHKIAVIGDIHPEMIAFYNAIKQGKSQDIHDFMVAHPNEEAVYYDVRDRMVIGSPLDLGCRFYYQRKTCFRGMSRYSKTGHFNISFGRYKSIDFSNLLDRKYEDLLQQTDVLHTTFEIFFERYNDDNNFMFLDPPYDSTFTDYGYCEFGKDHHRKLAQLFKTTKIRCLMIIGKTDFITELYQDYIVGEYDKKYRFKLYDGRVGDEMNNSHLIIKNY